MRLDNFLISNCTKEDEVIQHFRREAIEKEVPFVLEHPEISPYHGRLLSILIGLYNPENVLHVGMNLGVASMYIINAMGQGHFYTGIERNKYTYVEGINDFANEKKVRVDLYSIFDPLEVNIDSIVHFLYISGDKLKYKEYWEKFYQKVTIGGIIVIDGTEDVRCESFNMMLMRQKDIEYIALPYAEGVVDSLTIIKKIKNEDTRWPIERK